MGCLTGRSSFPSALHPHTGPCGLKRAERPVETRRKSLAVTVTDRHDEKKREKSSLNCQKTVLITTLTALVSTFKRVSEEFLELEQDR